MSIFTRLLRNGTRTFLSKDKGYALTPASPRSRVTFFLAKVDRVIADRLQGTKVAKFLIFVDDYLVFVDCEQLEYRSEFTRILWISMSALQPCNWRTIPERLSALCRNTNKVGEGKEHRTKKHRQPFVNCRECVVYFIPLSCDRFHNGQTGQCISDRLKKHQYNVTKQIFGHLGIHCRDCGCTPDYQKS